MGVGPRLPLYSCLALDTLCHLSVPWPLPLWNKDDVNTSLLKWVSTKFRNMYVLSSAGAQLVDRDPPLSRGHLWVLLLRPLAGHFVSVGVVWRHSSAVLAQMRPASEGTALLTTSTLKCPWALHRSLSTSSLKPNQRLHSLWIFFSKFRTHRNHSSYPAIITSYPESWFKIVFWSWIIFLCVTEFPITLCGITNNSNLHIETLLRRYPNLGVPQALGMLSKRMSTSCCKLKYLKMK